MSNIDWTLVGMIRKEIGLPPTPAFYDECIQTDTGSAGTRRTQSRRCRGRRLRSHKSSDIPGGSIARERRGNEQNGHLLGGNSARCEAGNKQRPV